MTVRLQIREVSESLPNSDPFGCKRLMPSITNTPGGWSTGDRGVELRKNNPPLTSYPREAKGPSARFDFGTAS
jgi:hypothetical protein